MDDVITVSGAGDAVLLEMIIDVVRRMGVIAEDGPAGARLVVGEAVLDDAGAVRVGVLGTLADCASGVHALGVLEDATPVTADLVVHATGAPVSVGTTVVATSKVLTQRRTGAVFDVSLFADHPGGELLGLSTVTYSPLRTDGFRYASDPLVSPWPPPDLARSLDELVSLRPIGDGTFEVDLEDGLLNGVAALAGGFTTLLVDVVAERAASTVLDVPVVVTDQIVHFLAPGRFGPIGVDVQVVRTSGGATAQVRLMDRGAGDRLVVTSTAGLRVSGPAQGC